MLQMWNTGWSVQFLVCRNGRSNSEWYTTYMWGVTGPSVQWLWIQFWWQFVSRHCNFICGTAVLSAINTFQLCWSCSCVKWHTRRVGTCRGLPAQGCINGVFSIIFISAVSVAAAVRSCCICILYGTTIVQLWCPAPNVSVLVLPFPMSCSSLLINVVLVVPWSNKEHSLGASKETTHTLHAFLKVGKNLLGM